MRLYAGTSQQFFQDTVQSQIAEKLKLAFFNYFRYYPSPSEINSWRNSLRDVSMVFQDKMYTIATLFEKTVLLPKPHVLQAMKLNSAPNRDKENKRIKDIADIYALLWHSDIALPQLKTSFSQPIQKRKQEKQYRTSQKKISTKSRPL